MKFTPDSKFFIFCTRLVALVKINLLWMLCCLPVVTAGAGTTAMITCLYAYRAEEPCGGKVFFGAFLRHFKTATALWLLLCFFAAMLMADYAIVAHLEIPGRMAVIGVIFFVLFLVVLVSGMVFPLLSQFPARAKDTLINAILLCIAHLPKMLLVTAMNVFPLLLAVLLPQVLVLLGFVWLLCGFALMGLYDITVLEKIFVQFREP